MEYTLSRKMEHLKSSAVRDILKLTQGQSIISFAGGLPAEDLFPVEAVAEAAERVFFALLLRLAQQAYGRLVPEMHDEVGAAGDFRSCLPRGLGIAVAELGAHVLAADEGRVADDELGFRHGARRGFS